MLKDETSKKLKSTINFEETLERFNKKKSKDLTVNDLQLEITVVKQEMLGLKNEFKNLKDDNQNILFVIQGFEFDLLIELLIFHFLHPW